MIPVALLTHVQKVLVKITHPLTIGDILKADGGEGLLQICEGMAGDTVS
jgi:hypothetical protein